MRRRQFFGRTDPDRWSYQSDSASVARWEGPIGGKFGCAAETINRPPVRPKAKRLPSTGLANTGRRPRLTLDRRTGLKYGKMAIVLGLALYKRAGQQCRKRCKGPPGQFGRG